MRWLVVVLCVLALWLPAYFFARDLYWLPLFTRYMALAIFALSVDLVWGYTGLLSLGQGLYFGLGVYAVGYCLKLRQAALLMEQPYVAGPDMALPNFMAFNRLTHVPAWIAPLIDIWWALALAVVVPTLVAAVFGMVVFPRRIKGVYFSLITQGLLLAIFTLVDTQIAYTGGRVGMNGCRELELFGQRIETSGRYRLTGRSLMELQDKGVPASLVAKLKSDFIKERRFETEEDFLDHLKRYIPAAELQPYQDVVVKQATNFFQLHYVVVAVLVIAFLACTWLVHSKFGKVLTAIRDNENRVLALGYNTAMYKTFIFALAGGLAGVAGALYVSNLGTAGPDRFGIVFSIEVVIMVAVGGRGTLFGAILGAILVSFGETYIGDLSREFWAIIMGTAFIFVVLFMPEGIVGFLPKLIKWVFKRSPIAGLMRLGKV